MTDRRRGPALRPVGPDDEPFLRSLYAEFRAPEFAPLGLTPQALDALLRMQFDVQDRGYHERYRAANYDIVTIDGRPSGRLYVDRNDDSIHLIDITLAASHRGRGIGTVLLRSLTQEGAHSERPVTLTVARGNRAEALYRRLGFESTREDEVYLQLAWCPPGAVS